MELLKIRDTSRVWFGAMSLTCLFVGCVGAAGCVGATPQDSCAAAADHLRACGVEAAPPEHCNAASANEILSRDCDELGSTSKGAVCDYAVSGLVPFIDCSPPYDTAVHGYYAEVTSAAVAAHRCTLMVQPYDYDEIKVGMRCNRANVNAQQWRTGVVQLTGSANLEVFETPRWDSYWETSIGNPSFGGSPLKLSFDKATKQITIEFDSTTMTLAPFDGAVETVAGLRGTYEADGTSPLGHLFRMYRTTEGPETLPFSGCRAELSDRAGGAITDAMVQVHVACDGGMGFLGDLSLIQTGSSGTLLSGQLQAYHEPDQFIGHYFQSRYDATAMFDSAGKLTIQALESGEPYILAQRAVFSGWFGTRTNQ